MQKTIIIQEAGVRLRFSLNDLRVTFPACSGAPRGLQLAGLAVAVLGWGQGGTGPLNLAQAPPNC